MCVRLVFDTMQGEAWRENPHRTRREGRLCYLAHIQHESSGYSVPFLYSYFFSFCVCAIRDKLVVAIKISCKENNCKQDKASFFSSIFMCFKSIELNLFIFSLLVPSTQSILAGTTRNKESENRFFSI